MDQPLPAHLAAARELLSLIPNQLQSLYEKPGAQLVFLYGHRQVGKSRPLRSWLGGLPGPALYWCASETSAPNQLGEFSRAVFKHLYPNIKVQAGLDYGSWERAWDELAQAGKTTRLVVVLDDFFRVLRANPGAGRALQTAWDNRLNGRTELMIIAAGTPLGPGQWAEIERPAPLFRRATRRIRLEPLTFADVQRWLPEASLEEQVSAYAITGGVSGLLALWDPGATLAENLNDFGFGESIPSPHQTPFPPSRTLKPVSMLATIQILEQLDTPRNYMALLRSVGAGSDTLTAMAAKAGIARSNVLKYAGVLNDLGWLARELPVTVRYPARSRKGRYTITDPLLRFCFRDEPDLIWTAASLEQYIAKHAFPEICRQWVAAQGDGGGLPFAPEAVGRAWDFPAPGELVELPVAAVHHRSRDLLLGDCHWATDPIGADLVRQLARTAERLRPDPHWATHLYLFTRAPLDQEAQDLASAYKVRVIEF